MSNLRSRVGETVRLYPFHYVEVDDYWAGLYDGWRGVIGEMLGTLMYTFISAGLFIAANTFGFKDHDHHFSLLMIALGDGLAFMCFAFAFQRLSGGHLNPVITWAALITRRIGLLKGIAYILAQVGGGLLGALLISAATPDNWHGRLGSHFWDSSLTNFDGFLLIAVLTSFLIFVVFSVQFDPLHIGKLAPLPIGFTVVFCNLVSHVFVGPALNPARTFGTAVVYGTYDHIWEYWAAPAVGSTIASLLYALLFLTRQFPPTTEELYPTAKYTAYSSIPTSYTTTVPSSYSNTTVPSESSRLMGQGNV